MNQYYIILWGWVLLSLVDVFLLCMATRVECYMEGRECVLKDELTRINSVQRALLIYSWFPITAIAGVIASLIVILIPVWKALIKEREL